MKSLRKIHDIRNRVHEESLSEKNLPSSPLLQFDKWMKKADDGIPQTVAPVEEIQLYVRDASGKRVDVSFKDLIEKTMGRSVDRCDLHISHSRDGELFLTSRQDGMIRVLVPDSKGGS